MIRTLMIGAVSALAVTLSAAAFAQQGQFGTAAEAKAMLEKAVAAVKANKTEAIAMFNKGEGGFKDRDLYPFCWNTGDGIIIAGQAAVMGKDVRTLKDPTGKAFGEEAYNGVKEGQIIEVHFMFPRPGSDSTPVPKTSFDTKIGDVTCGVGYYN